MASFRKIGRNWFYRFIDGDGRQRERKGCPDKRETEGMAAAAEAEAAKVRGGLIDSRELAYRRHEGVSLSEHLDAWHRDMTARGRTARHADQYQDRAGRLAALTKGARLGDIEAGRTPEALDRTARKLADTLSAARLSDLTPERIQAALAMLRDSGKAPQTVNHFRAALRAFCRWAWETGRVRETPMRGVKGFNPEEGIRHERRSLTDDELARLVQAAASGPIVFGMPGPMRAMAYRLAAATGFRVAELRSLTRESFHLDGPDPCVDLEASATKNRRPAEQPVPRAMVPDLAEWLRDQPVGVPVLPLHHETAKAIRFDLEAAGIDYATEEGTADFHALRGYFVGALVRAGASVSEVRALARHAKPETTLKHYARVSVSDKRGVVESLPCPTTPERPQAVRATGTDGHISMHPSLGIPYGGDGTRRTLTEESGQTARLVGETGSDATPETVGICRNLTGIGAERGGFEPPKGCDTLNGLANRQAVGRKSLVVHGVDDSSTIAHPFPFPTGPSEPPPDLAAVIDAWPDLPEALRAGIVAMVRATPRT